MAAGGETGDAEAVRLAARSYAPDGYLSALLAPRAARADLVALAAYLGEIRRVPLEVSEPALGEMRLQWWRDSIGATADGHRTGNPIADAMIDVVRRHEMPRDLTLAPVEGRSRELYEDGIADEAEFEAYLDETEGAALRIAWRILGAPQVALADATLLAGRAIGRTRTALALPVHLANGRLPLPPARVFEGDPRTLPEADARMAVFSATQVLINEARLDAAVARRAVAVAPKAAFPAFLQLALVEPYLRALEGRRRDPLLEPADISPLTRVSKLWLASLRGRV